MRALSGGWVFEPLVVATLAVSAGWYGAGLWRLWHHAGAGRSVRWVHAASFAGGLLAIIVALLSPLDALADALFSAHMTQHMILVVVAGPLLVLGRPVLPVLWAFPVEWRRRLGRWWAGEPILRRMLGLLTVPGVVLIAHAAALGFWHIPRAYGWAYAHPAVHAFEHATFLVSACLFWWVVFQPLGHRRLGWGGAILYVTAFGAAAGVFAAVLTFAPSPWYAEHAARVAAWGLAPLEDQQLAGLIMWIPAGFVYLAAASFCFVRWMESDAQPARRPRAVRVPRAGETGYGVHAVAP